MPPKTTQGDAVTARGKIENRKGPVTLLSKLPPARIAPPLRAGARLYDTLRNLAIASYGEGGGEVVAGAGTKNCRTKTSKLHARGPGDAPEHNGNRTNRGKSDIASPLLLSLSLSLVEPEFCRGQPSSPTPIIPLPLCARSGQPGDEISRLGVRPATICSRYRPYTPVGVIKSISETGRSGKGTY